MFTKEWKKMYRLPNKSYRLSSSYYE